VGGARSSDVIFGHISFGVGSSGGGQLDDGAARRSMSRAGETELWACNNEEAKEVTGGSDDRTFDVRLKKLARVAR
jgi:hypothetical protein